jgi:enterochelin esterase family protein
MTLTTDAGRRAIAFTLALTCAAPALAQQAHINLDWAPQRNAAGLVPFGASIISPEVDEQRRVTFRVKAARAQDVQLSAGTIAAGLGRGESTWPFTKGADGTWTLTIGPVPQNIYVYKFVIDGVSVVDPNNTLGGFGNQPGYSTLVVHGDGPAYYDAKPVPHGAITRHVYRSTVTDGERELYVYTPPDYDRTKTYPVLYLLGGSGEIASGWWLDGRAGFIADNLIADGGAVPMIIAMPNNQVVHRSDPQHTEKTFAIFDRELRTEIVPLVESQYRVQADRHGRAIAGLSMGGRHAQLVGFKALDLFASFGILSAGDPASETTTPEFLKDPDTNTKVDYLLVGLGTLENQPTNRSVAFHQILEKHGIRHDYVVGGNGAHDWATWRWLLHEKLLPNLFRHRK